MEIDFNIDHILVVVMKRLRFAEPLPEMILNGCKTTTWRINDEKEIRPGDILSLCHVEGHEFAKASVETVRITLFGQLSSTDFEGHESFQTRDEMLSVYSKYYGFAVTEDTPVKVIKFRMIETI
jgi:hypothetical protein